MKKTISKSLKGRLKRLEEIKAVREWKCIAVMPDYPVPGGFPVEEVEKRLAYHDYCAAFDAAVQAQAEADCPDCTMTILVSCTIKDPEVMNRYIRRLKSDGRWNEGIYQEQRKRAAEFWAANPIIAAYTKV